jgi:hypothetical protein
MSTLECIMKKIIVILAIVMLAGGVTTAFAAANDTTTSSPGTVIGPITEDTVDTVVLDANGNSPGTFVCGKYDVNETIARLERERDEAIANGDEDTAAMRRTDIVAAGMCG